MVKLKFKYKRFFQQREKEAYAFHISDFPDMLFCIDTIKNAIKLLNYIKDIIIERD